MARKALTWTIDAGGSRPFALAWVDEDGNPVSLEGATEAAVIFKFSTDDADSNARIARRLSDGTLSVLGPPSRGLTAFALLPADTANVTGRNKVTYAWKAKATFPDGSVRYGGYGSLVIAGLG